MRCPTCGERWYGTLAGVRLSLHRLTCRSSAPRLTQLDPALAKARAALVKAYAAARAKEDYRRLCLKYGEVMIGGGLDTVHYANLRKREDRNWTTFVVVMVVVAILGGALRPVWISLLAKLWL